MALDWNSLYSDATETYEAAKNNPDRRGDPDAIFAKHTLDEMDALAGELRTDAQTRLDTEPLKSAGASYKRKFLVSRFADGKFDA